MTEIIITGNPNAGKTTLFNALTGRHDKTGNWHGVTVGISSNRKDDFLITDVPGIYSLKTFSMEEKISADYILSHKDGIFLFTAECSTLPRSIMFFNELTSKGIKSALILTKYSSFKKHGGKISKSELRRICGVPVYFFEEINFFSLNKLCREITNSSPVYGELTNKAFTNENCKPNKFEKLLLKPFFSLPLFAALLLFMFFAAFGEGMPGTVLKDVTEKAINALCEIISKKMSSALAKGFICDCLLKSVGTVLSFIPQIAILYLFLLLAEDSGLMSYCAFCFDDFFSLIGLNGRAVFSLLMGFGCTAAATYVSRGLENKKIQRRTILAMQYIPCSARIPVAVMLLSPIFKNVFFGVLLLYTMNLSICLTAAYLMKGEDKEIFILEIPRISVPKFNVALKSLLFQLKQFIIKVSTVMTGFLVGTWLLSSASPTFSLCSYEESILARMCGILKYLFYPMGITDWKTAFAALSGLAAKENIAGILSMFYPDGLNASFDSLVAFSVFVMLCPPCVSALAAAIKESGRKSALLNFFIQTAVSFIAAYSVYFLLEGGAVLFFISIVIFIIIMAAKKAYERINRKRKLNIKKIHG